METRDRRGRYVKGHPGNRTRPGEVVVAHPRYAGRDCRGRLTKGHAQLYFSEPVRRLKLALLSAVGEDEVAGACRELIRLTKPGPHGPAVQLGAIDLLLTYLLGKPTVPVAVHPLPEPPGPGLDLTRLTTDELDQLQRLLDKARPGD